MKKERENTKSAVDYAQLKWQQAPAHIRAMAGAYVNPLMLAILSIDQELQQLQNAIGAVSPVKKECEKCK